jgi:siroheme synthase (precorrin-2 oxidase/ferrochelatase)
VAILVHCVIDLCSVRIRSFLKQRDRVQNVAGHAPAALQRVLKERLLHWVQHQLRSSSLDQTLQSGGFLTWDFTRCDLATAFDLTIYQYIA